MLVDWLSTQPNGLTTKHNNNIELTANVSLIDVGEIGDYDSVLSKDGKRVVIHSSSFIRVYLFKENQWILEADLYMHITPAIKDSRWDLAISDNGDRIVASTAIPRHKQKDYPFDDPVMGNIVLTYSRCNDTEWILENVFNPNVVTYERYNFTRVNLSGDGKTMVVALLWPVFDNNNYYAIYVYTSNGWLLVSKIEAYLSNRFYISPVISYNGDTIFINQNHIEVYKRVNNNYSLMSVINELCLKKPNIHITKLAVSSKHDVLLISVIEIIHDTMELSLLLYNYKENSIVKIIPVSKELEDINHHNVSMSSVGDRIAVSINRKSAANLIFVFNKIESSDFIKKAILEPSLFLKDIDCNFIGNSLSMSGDGKTLTIGMLCENTHYNTKNYSLLSLTNLKL